MTALLFLCFDAFIHYYVYGEPQIEIIPEDKNELWMRTVIVLLIISFGVYADFQAKKLLLKEKQLEAARIYRSMTQASRHILNNLLNQMQLVKMEALRCDEFDREIIEFYDKAFDEAKQLIKQLSEVEDITDENIWASVDPGKISKSFKKTGSASKTTWLNSSG